ncbi:hypothetical protein BT96DRAFT_932552 [Gymnopus androsaceus JB14]|uniref:Transcription factor domain-containing protein n=1 Tax=Gymnopus androsaceus JB14 TaxID=1447944 RepID=A0A6A4IDX5_9AGAR|nr:hypothetical protein BT96DRAFT_932552 [Gymnopus androsaceus JB14]
MSPGSGTSENASSKKRRLPGGDSGGMVGQRCTNCVNAGADCTHVELTKNLGSAKGYEWFIIRFREIYVEGLEQRLEKMQMLLQKMLPGVDIAEELDNDFDCPLPEAELPRNDHSLTMHLENLTLDPSRKRFSGRSSTLYLVETALHHKQQFVGESFNRTSVMRGPEDWQIRYLQYPQPQYNFPPEDLNGGLNLILPLLHRPTFENGIADGFHQHDPFFGGTVLLVCAIGARYCDDPRVFSEGPSVPSSAGWHCHRRNLLSTRFNAMHGLSQGYDSLEKYLDSDRFRFTLSTVDCDDEYWDHPDPSMNFKQPADTPSKLSFFVHFLKLMDILAYAMRAIYPIRQHGLLFSRPRIQSMQQLIAQLDSFLNQWLNAVPEHLQWDPNRPGPFFKQSAMLYCNYYHMQIFIHRPFIPEASNPTSVSVPSLTMCAMAARACSHVARAMVQQNVLLPFPQCARPSYFCSVHGQEDALAWLQRILMQCQEWMLVFKLSICVRKDGRHQARLRMDDTTMSLWTAAPTGYQEDDWKAYLSSLQGIDGNANPQTHW